MSHLTANADVELPTLEPLLWRQGRRVLRTQEYGRVPVDSAALIKNGRLDIYGEILGAGVVNVQAKKGEVYIQAGGLIGFLPLNDDFALEINPRVPIANLERILNRAKAQPLSYFTSQVSSFSVTNRDLPESFWDLYAERLITLVEMCWSEGLHSNYDLRIAEGINPKGKILVGRTAQRRGQLGGWPIVSYAQLVRSHDTPLNRCLVAALEKLYVMYAGMRARAGAKSLANRLSRARHLLSGVPSPKQSTFLTDSLVADPSKIPSFRYSYPEAINLARVVLDASAIDVRSNGGDVALPPILLNLEDIFEDYLAAVLGGDANEFLTQGKTSKSLFRSASEGSEWVGVKAKPDIICTPKVGGTPTVIDAKYKPSVDREDINQVLAYALSYNTDTVVLVSPRRNQNSISGLTLLGKMERVKVYHYVIDLGSSDLGDEESKFAGIIGEAVSVAEPL